MSQGVAVIESGGDDTARNHLGDMVSQQSTHTAKGADVVVAHLDDISPVAVESHVSVTVWRSGSA